MMVLLVWLHLLAVLLLTGPPLLHLRGIPSAAPSGWPMILVAKLGLVTILLLLTLTHDLILGPHVGKIVLLPTESRTRFDQTLVLWSSGVVRFSLALTLAVLFAAVLLVRT